MASSPNVRPSPNSATGADVESASAATDVAASAAASASASVAAAAAAAAATTQTENQVVWKREQSGDALKVAKVLCVCYLIFGVDGGKRIADMWLWTLVPAGLDSGYHFYGNIYAIMIWACEAIPSLGSKCGIMLGDSFIQRPRCTCWKLKKLGHIDFTTFFDDESADIAPRTRPSSSTTDLSPIPLEYSSTTIPADTYHSPRLQYRSYRPHSPFSTTIVRKRKDLDEEAYRRWLDSGESVNVGAACGASASWFLMLQDASTLIDAEHLDAYMGILQFDPGFVGVRWLDDWAAQTVLVHTSFLTTCINVWNNSQRKGGPLSIDDEDLDFLVSHVHGLRPFWGDGSYARNALTIWNTSPESSCGHWLVLRIRLEEGIIIMHDSLAQEEEDAYLKLRSHQSLGISFLIPTILQRSGFYERRLDITPVPQFRVAIAKKDLCYVHDDSTSCGALSIRTLESLFQHSFSQGKTETDIYAFRGRMTRAIWRFSDDADTVVCDPTSLFIRFDDRD
ncbi:hypothetical protein OROMI_025046 [Orobanche minor]